MRLGQLLDFFDLTGKNHVVTTHNKLILVNRHLHTVEMLHLDQFAALHIHQTGIA